MSALFRNGNCSFFNMVNRKYGCIKDLVLAGLVYLLVAGLSSCSSCSDQDFIPDPRQVDPPSGWNGQDTPVTISGQGFVAPIRENLNKGGSIRVLDEFRVELEISPLLEIVYRGSGSIDAVVPAGLTPGTYDLTVINPDGTSGTLPDAFTVLDYPLLERPSLVATLATDPVQVSEGQEIQITLEVENQGEAGVNDLTGILTVIGSGEVELVEEPETSSVSLAPYDPTLPGGYAEALTWIYRAVQSGTVEFSGSASGSDEYSQEAVSSPVVIANPVTIQTPCELFITLTIAPGNYNLDQPIPISLTIQNLGEAGCQEFNTVWDIYPGPNIDIAPFPYPLDEMGIISGGGSETITGEGIIPITGTHAVSVSVSGNDVNSGESIYSHTASSSSIAIQNPAVLSITEVTAVPDAVAVGQMGISVSMTVENTGQAGAVVDAASLTFSLGTYSQTVVSPTLPVTIPGGGSQIFTFSVDVDPASATGVATIDGQVSGTDANSGEAVSDSSAAITDSWTVQVPSSLSIEEISTRPTTVVRGQTGILVAMTVSNPGTADTQVNTAQLTFISGTYTQNLTSPVLPVTIPGGGSQVFWFEVDVDDASATGLDTIDGTVSGTDSVSGQTVSDDSATATDSWTVVSPAEFSIDYIIAPASVSQGQTGVVVLMAVDNLGDSDAQVDTAALTFSLGTYSQSFSTPPLPVTIPALGSQNFAFTVDVDIASATGVCIIDGLVSGTDVISGQPVSDNSAAATDSWTVQTPAVLSITIISTASTTVAQGETGILVTMTVDNTGQADANLTSAQLTFTLGTYTQSIADPVLPDTVPGGGSRVVYFRVDVDVDSEMGSATINGQVSGEDANSGAATSDSSAATTDSWTVTRLQVGITGTLFVTTQIEVGDNIEITLDDADLIDYGTIVVYLEDSNGEYEYADLFEDPTYSGVFTGTVPTDGSSIGDDDGTIEVANGDFVYTLYYDAKDNNNSPRTTVQSTEVKSLPGAGNLSTSNKTSGAGSYEAGDTVSFTVNAINSSGSNDVTGTVVRDTVPPGLTYKPGSIAGTDGDGSPLGGGDLDDTQAPLLEWSIGTLEDGESGTATFEAYVNPVTCGMASLDIVNVADIISTNSLSKTVTRKITVDNPAQLQVELVEVIPLEVYQGGTFYEAWISVKNVGGYAETITSATLKFRAGGGASVNADYTVTEDAGNPASIDPCATEIFSFTVDVGAAATIGFVTVNGAIYGSTTSDSDASRMDIWRVLDSAAPRILSTDARPGRIDTGGVSIFTVEVDDPQGIGTITSVTVNTAPASPTMTVVNLNDDGTSPDETADDGIWTGWFYGNGATVGVYAGLTVTATDADSNTDTAPMFLVIGAGYEDLTGSYKIVDDPTPHPGDMVTFRIFVTNASTASTGADQIDVVDVIPTGIVYEKGSVWYDDNNPPVTGLSMTIDESDPYGAGLTFDFGGACVLDPGETVVLAYRARVLSPSNQIINIATIQSLNYTYHVGVTLTVKDLNRHPVVSDQQATPGMVGGAPWQTMFTASATDPDGTISSVMVDLSDFTGGSSTQPMYDDGTNGDVTPGDGVYSYLYTVPVPDRVQGFYNLLVTATDNDGLEDTEIIQMSVMSGDLSASSKVVKSGELVFKPGDTLEWEIEASNALGGASAQDVEIYERVPHDFDYTGTHNDGSTDVFIDNDPVLYWFKSQVSGGSSVKVRFEVEVNHIPSGSYTNQAVIFSSNAVDEVVESTVTIDSEYPEVSTSSPATGETILSNPGSIVIYLSDSGGSEVDEINSATGATLRYDNNDDGLFDQNVVGSWDTSTPDRIAFTPSASLTDGYAYQVSFSPTDAVGNTTDNHLIFIYDSTAAGSGITVEKNANTPSVGQFNQIWYTVKLTNVSGSACTGVTVTDYAPTYYVDTIDNISGGGSESGGEITWGPFTLPAGENTTLFFSVNSMDNNDGDLIFNKVNVTGTCGVAQNLWDGVAVLYDETAPQVIQMKPANGTTIFTPYPVISANYTDNVGYQQIDPKSVAIRVDEKGVTVFAEVTEYGVRITPVTPMDEGSHDIEVEVTDLAGNRTNGTWSFTIDLGGTGGTGPFFPDYAP